MPRFKMTFDHVANKTRVEETDCNAERHPPRGTLGGQVVCVADYRNYEEACIAAEAMDKGLRLELPREQHLKVPIDLDLGRAAYEGYFKACEGLSLITGAKLPTWSGQMKDIQRAWREAATAVVRVACPAAEERR